MKTLAFLGKIAYPNHENTLNKKQRQPQQEDQQLIDSGFSFKKLKSAKPGENKSLSKQCSLNDIDIMSSGQHFQLKSIRSRFDDSLTNVQMRSKERSLQKHALKPCLVPKFATVNEISQAFNKNNRSISHQLKKREQSISNYQAQSGQKDFAKQFGKLQVWQQTKNGTNQTLGQLRFKKPDQQCENQNPNCSKHEQLKALMQDINRKYKFLSEKLNQLETKNKSLHSEIEKAQKTNNQNCQDAEKLRQQRQELSATKDKWQNSKRKLELLYNQICLRVQREKEKDNMGKEECQKYFGSKTKENRPVIGKQTQKKPNLASRIKIRVQRT